MTEAEPARFVWWVNQGKTYAKERDGAYIWAPRVTKSGSTVAHHTAVLDVRRGDRIIHYANGAIRATGIAMSDGAPATRPSELPSEPWEADGYQATVEYTELEHPIPLSDVDRSLRETSGGPFTVDGAVKLGYLYPLDERVGTHLAQLVHRRGRQPKLWVVYVEQSSLANLRHSLPEGKWGWKQRQEEYERFTPGDTILFAVGYTGGSPRTTPEQFLEHEFEELVVCSVTSPLQKESVTYWPDEVGEVIYPYRIGVSESDVETNVPTRDLDQRFGTGTAEAIRRSGSQQGRAYLVLADAAVPQRSAKQQVRHVSSVIPAPFATVVSAFSEATKAAGLDYGGRHDRLIASFLAALTIKPFVILTGLSGSGKTRLALALGQWLGDGSVCVLPVRPDWTSPDALLGYRDGLANLSGDHRQPWVVPEALEFMLKAVAHPDRPFVLILDEMNLAHVERYFADVLSGMESGQGVLPDLERDGRGRYVERSGTIGPRPLPDNLFIVGTVNVDETTYMFSPKVLDRANCFEFRVETDDLRATGRPTAVVPAAPELVAGFLAAARTPPAHSSADAEFEHAFRDVHRLLSRFDREFGHRTFQEAVRFARRLREVVPDPGTALDLQILQKVLPRLHGSRRELTDVLNELGAYCFRRSTSSSRFDAAEQEADGAALPDSYSKVHRMAVRLRDHHFVSFAE